MLHAILSVLVVIGHILLIVLLIVGILLFCILCTPICYRGRFRKTEAEMEGTVRVSWLIRVVYFCLDFREKHLTCELYILGIPLLSILKRRKAKKQGEEKAPKEKRKKKKRKKKKDKKALKAKQEERPEQEALRAEETADGPDPEETDTGGHPEEGSSRKKHGKAGAVLELLRSETFKNALHVILNEGKKLLDHILPRKIRGYVEFGMEDPASTGKILAALAVVYPILPQQLEIRPDFEEQGLEADIQAKGHIFLIVVVIRAIRIIKEKCVRDLIKQVRKLIKQWKQ